MEPAAVVEIGFGERRVLRASTKGSLQVGWPAVLFQQVSECFVGEFLEILHTITRQQIERVPSLIVELNTLDGHRGFLAVRANAVDGTAVWVTKRNRAGSATSGRRRA
jgi:hypothetical protein